MQETKKDHTDWYAKKSGYDYDQGFGHGYKHGYERAIEDMKKDQSK
ncbi:hypothetical protein D1BOALGB6SA_10335 [Olavius sp. associated proteobacterium Delta 1]|nr:hypothetical protein D1BOALGB6SA_10335 [Olavius sp. associated proteobacterium Delta 1]